MALKMWPNKERLEHPRARSYLCACLLSCHALKGRPLTPILFNIACVLSAEHKPVFISFQYDSLLLLFLSTELFENAVAGSHVDFGFFIRHYSKKAWQMKRLRTACIKAPNRCASFSANRTFLQRRASQFQTFFEDSAENEW